MSLSEKLEIFIITYNRANALGNTLSRLYAENSPVRNLSITILDNNSSDGTPQATMSYLRGNSNLRYIKNKYNVGLGGNLIKAMEMASKPYFWIVCDDDDFDWEQWGEVGQAVESEKYDIVMTTYTPGFRSLQIPYLLNEMCFVPSAIYKASNIDDGVMTNAYAMAHNLFPFHALSIKVINNRGNIFVPHGRVVLQSLAPKSHQVRELRQGIYRRLQTFSLLWGYVEAYSLIKDKKLRHQCMDVLCLGKSFFSSMTVFLNWFPFTLQNLFDVFYYVSWRQKLQLSLVCFLHIFPVRFYKTDRGINICLFWKLKTKIWPLMYTK